MDKSYKIRKTGLNFFSTPNLKDVLEKAELSDGGHDYNAVEGIDGKMCAMELVAVLNGDKWTDFPSCTANYIASAAQIWNDGFSPRNWGHDFFGDRTSVVMPIIPHTVGTAGADAELKKRSRKYARDRLYKLRDRIADLYDKHLGSNYRSSFHSTYHGRASSIPASGVDSLMQLAGNKKEHQRAAHDIARMLKRLKFEMDDADWVALTIDIRRHCTEAFINTCRIVKGVCVEKEEG